MQQFKKLPASKGGRPIGVMRPIACSVMLAWCELASANPTGAQVAAGSAGFSTSGKTLTVTNTPGTIINWNAFSIGAGETTRFVQQSALSSVLNRVGPGRDASSILGTLWSNGRVFLINPNGIVFGRNAVVDTAGFIASTLNMTDQDFLSGKLRFSGGGNGVLRNAGEIRASGDIYLVGPMVRNSGLIRSEEGGVLLAAGKAVTITSPDAHGITFTIQSPGDRAINIGRIEAATAAGLFAGTLRHSGDITVTGAHLDTAGRIVVVAQKDATIEAGSTMSASGAQGGQITVQAGDTTLVSGRIEALGHAGAGGTIHVLGDKVGVLDGAIVDASGTTGGGTVLIGGDYRGANPAIQNASGTYFGDAASVKADATVEGDGGRIIVWGTDAARVYGAISAHRAGAGRGGFVETSGHYLDVTSDPDIGAGGTWLLDPFNIIVTPSTTSNNSGPPAFTPSGNDSQVSANQINSQLAAGTNVTLDTGGPASAGSQAGDITVNAVLSSGLSSTASLTLNANNSVTFNPGSGFGLLRGSLNINTQNPSGTVSFATSSGNPMVSDAGTFNFNLAGALVLQANGRELSLITLNGQNITARSMSVLSAPGAFAGLENAGGTQNITINNAGSGTGIDIIANGSQAYIVNSSGVSIGGVQSAPPGPQNITINDGDRLRIVAGGDLARISSLSSVTQTVTLKGTGQNRIEIGSPTATSTSSISGGTQSITAGQTGQSGAIVVQGGVTNGQQSVITNSSGTQTVSTSGTLTLLGGTATGATSGGCTTAGACALIQNQGGGVQSVTAQGAAVNGGSGGAFNLGSITSFTTMQLNVGSGGLSVQGGAGNTNAARIGGSSTFNATVAGATTITGGSGANSDATVGAGSSTINFNGTGDITLTGGSAASASAGIGRVPTSPATTVNLTLTGAGKLTLNSGSGAGAHIGHPNASVGGGILDVTVAGDIALTGSATQPSAIRSTNNVNVTGASLSTTDSTISGSAVVVTADDMNIGSPITATATATLRPLSLGRNVNVEASPTAGTLSLTPAELNFVTASQLDLGRSDGTGDLSTTAALSNAQIHATTLRLLSGGDASILAPIDRASGGNLNIVTTGVNDLVTITRDVTAGGSMSFSLAGGLAVRSDAAQSAIVSAGAGQTIAAKYIELVSQAATAASLRNNFSGPQNASTQTITTSGMNAGGEGLALRTLGGNGPAATIFNSSTGAQTITVNNAQFLRLGGGGGSTGNFGSWILANAGTQTIAAQGNVAGGNNIEVGVAGAAGFSQIAGRSQSITAGTAGQSGSITVVGGGTDGTNGSIVNTAGTQTVRTAGALTLTGGNQSNTAANALGASGAISNNVNTTQTVSANAISLAGGTVGSSNQATLVSTGSQAITINGGGNVAVTGGSGSTNDLAQIVASGGSQTLTFAAGGNLVLTGGTNGTLNAARVRTTLAGATQTITGAAGISITGGASGGGFVTSPSFSTRGNFAQVSSTGSQVVSVGAGGITMTGGGGTASDNFANIFQSSTAQSAQQAITVNGGGSIVLVGGSSSGSSAAGQDGSGSFSFIRADGGAGQSISFTGAGSMLKITGGTVGSGNNAGLRAQFGQQTITGAPAIVLTGGASGGAPNDGNNAIIVADTLNQTIDAAGITVTGGSGGIANSASIRTRGSASTQSVTASGIAITGGAGGGAEGSSTIDSDGNFGEIRGDANQTVTAGAGGILIKGGSGSGADNFAQLRQGRLGSGNPATPGTSQAVIVTDGGSITLEGGSTSSVATANGNGSRARIRGEGDVQTIAFTDGGAINLTGGTIGTANEASIFSNSAAQVITGSPTLTMRGGASGGAAGDGNFAQIRSDVSQVFFLGAADLKAGTGTDTSASIQAPLQTITVDGNLVLTGSDAGVGSANGARIGALRDQTGATVLLVHGNATLTGGAQSNAIIGPTGNSTIAQTSTIAVSADGDVILNGGAAGGTRIGHAETLVGGGDLSVSAGRDVVLNGTGTGANIRTGGGIALQAGRDVVASGEAHIAGAATVVSGAGALRFTSGNATVDGALTAAMPVALAGATVAFNGETSLDAGATFTAGRLQGTGGITVSGATLAWSGGTLAGTGVFTTGLNATTSMSGTVSVDGKTWHNAGVVNMAGGGEVILQNNASIDNLASASWNVGSGLGSVMSGSGAFNNAGLLRHTGAGNQSFAPAVLTNTGKISVDEGTLTVAGFTSNAGTIFVQSGATLAAPSFINAGAITGTGTIKVNDPLAQTGTLTNAGTVAPGSSPGMLTVDGNYTQTSAGILNIELAGATPGTEYDVLNVTGTATLGGTVNLTPINGYTPPPGQSYNVVTYNNSSGDFSSAPPGFNAAPGPMQYTVTPSSGTGAAAQAAIAAPSNETVRLADQSSATTRSLEQESIQQQEEKAVQKEQKRDLARECR